MAARRYEISLRVLKKYFPSERSKRIKYFSIPLKNRVYFDKGAAAKGASDCATIATMIFSLVKITFCFHECRYEVFARKISWCFIGVHIIKSSYH